MNYLFNNRFISDYDNIDFFENKMTLYQTINLDEIKNNEDIYKKYDYMTYGSVISHDDSNYMICRLDDSNMNRSFNTHKIRKIIINYNDDIDKFSLEYDTTKEFNIELGAHNDDTDKFSLEYDTKKQYLELGAGNHNASFHIIKKKNEIELYLVCGKPIQSLTTIIPLWKKKWPTYCKRLENDKDKYIMQVNEVPDNEIIRTRKYMSTNNYIEQNHICPFYGNGSYLFKIKDIHNFESIVPLFKDKPTFHRWIGGNYDMCYGWKWEEIMNFRRNSSTYEEYLEDIENKFHNNRGGLQIWDTIGSFIYNEDEEQYYFYHRANVLDLLRNIQYTTSKNLVDWSQWNLIKYSKDQNEKIAIGNYYQANLFTIDNVKGYFGVMGYHETTRTKRPCIKSNGCYELFYSVDCITWDVYKNFIPDDYIYEKTHVKHGGFINKKNKYYLFSSEINKIKIYSIDKNRLLYAHNINNKIGTLLTKPIKIKNLNNIHMNFETLEDGYITVKLLDKNKNEIQPYTYENFVNITENMNEPNFKLTWKNDNIETEEVQETNEELEEINEYYIEITGKNFKIYSICC